ncbi:MAG: arsenite methyltransferase [Candidatus Bathyarchaeia archaeon]
MKEEEIKKIVRESYAKAAKKETCCCNCAYNEKIGYGKAEIESVPESAASSLGCGNPVAFASLKEGETVLDLGCGGGLDCFLAASKVGEKGHVIGVDMTPEMIDKARENCRKGGYKNVEFRLGEIENLPVADNTADAIISNCVINLSPNKKRVFKEAFRVLKPGGRLMISDIALLKKLPEAVKKSKKAYVSCVAGAIHKDEYIQLIKDAGFQNVEIIEETTFPADCIADASDMEVTTKELAESIVSITIKGVKPEK